MHTESLIPVGSPRKRNSPAQRSTDSEQAGPSNAAQPGRSEGEQPPVTTNTENKNSNNPKKSEEEKRIPMLIRGRNVHQVIPIEATRDVLAGRVDFYLVDDKDGVIFFPAKHIFAALKLDKEHREKFEDYSCVGAHQRIFEQRPKRRQGMGYRRKYISPELIHRGVYGPDGQYAGTARGRAMSSGALLGRRV